MLGSPREGARYGGGRPDRRLLQQWRKTRHLSQLGLAMQAAVSSSSSSASSSRQGAPTSSREMVLRLAGRFDVPLRDRNALHLLRRGLRARLCRGRSTRRRSARYGAPSTRSSGSEEPFPAVVMNRQWDIVQTNEAATRFFTFLLGRRRLEGAGERAADDVPPGRRAAVREELELPWHGLRCSCSGCGGRRSAVQDEGTRAVLAEVLDYPWRSPVTPGGGRSERRSFPSCRSRSRRAALRATISSRR